MALAQTMLGSAYQMGSLFTSGGKGAHTASSTELSCPIVRCRQGQRPHAGVPRARNMLSVSWTKADESQRSCSLRRVQCRAQTYTVEILQNGVKHVLQVPEDETILSVALDENLDMSYDCKLGVCMTCPVRLEKGNVDQSGGMLSEDVIEKGYALMCVSYPLSDCTISTIPEEEVLGVQLATANDN